MTAPATVERDLIAGAAYPGFLLEGCETALILFAAGFYGKQDAAWVAEAGLRAICVDTDQEKLDAMHAMYPADWHFVCEDVFWYADEGVVLAPQHWDIVSLDPWTRDFQKCADNIEAWCALARRGVILGTGVGTKVEAPDGWAVTEVRKRSDYDGGVFWTCLEPDWVPAKEVGEHRDADGSRWFGLEPA